MQPLDHSRDSCAGSLFGGDALSALAQAAQEIVGGNQRAKFMSEASAALASSLDYEETLATVARLAVPKLGDWCLIDVADETGQLRRLAVTHVDPEKIALAKELDWGRYPEKQDLEFGVLSHLSYRETGHDFGDQ